MWCGIWDEHGRLQAPNRTTLYHYHELGQRHNGWMECPALFLDPMVKDWFHNLLGFPSLVRIPIQAWYSMLYLQSLYISVSFMNFVHIYNSKVWYEDNMISPPTRHSSILQRPKCSAESFNFKQKSPCVCIFHPSLRDTFYRNRIYRADLTISVSDMPR